MRRWKCWGIAIVMCAGLSGHALAEEVAPSKWYDYVTVGGELRLRPEGYWHFLPFTPVRIAYNNDAYVLLRARINLDARPVNHLRVYIQPQFSRTFAQSESTIANSISGTTEGNQIDLHQAFMTFEKIADAPVDFQAGRMELIYGEQRLVGNLDWNNVGRNFDGARMHIGKDKLWLDGFWTWIRRNGPNQYFSGLYGHWAPGDWLTVEPYTFYLRDDGMGIGGGNINNATIGVRAAGKVGGWTYSAEVPIQVGKSGAQKIWAQAANARVDYMFPVFLKPSVGAEFSYASGDSTPGVGTVKTFNQLFPTFHDKHGNMDVVGWRNIYDAAGHVGIRPTDKTIVRMEYHAFWLPEPADGLYAANGLQERAGSATARRFVGQELDFLGYWNWNKYAAFQVGYSLFKSGAFLKDTGASSLAQWGYVQLLTRF